MVRKKTLEDHNYNSRQGLDYSGTGPFRHKKCVDKEVWIRERNPDYWNEGIPYLDGLEFSHFDAASPALDGALLTGKIDYGRGLDPVTLQKVQFTPGMTGTNFYQSMIRALWVNNAKTPFDDPRVRRAMHMVLDQLVLVEVLKEVLPLLVGGFIYPFSDFATLSATLSARLGYPSDPQRQSGRPNSCSSLPATGRGSRRSISLSAICPLTSNWRRPSRPC